MPKFTINHPSVQLYNDFHTVEFRPRRTQFRGGFPSLAKHLIKKRYSYSDAVFYNPRALSNKETVNWKITIEKVGKDRPIGKQLEIGFSLISHVKTKENGWLERDMNKIDCIVLDSRGWLKIGNKERMKDKVCDGFSEGDVVEIKLDFRKGFGCFEFLKNGKSFGMMPYDVNSSESKLPLKLCTCRLMVGLWSGDRVTLC